MLLTYIGKIVGVNLCGLAYYLEIFPFPLLSWDECWHGILKGCTTISSSFLPVSVCDHPPDSTIWTLVFYATFVNRPRSPGAVIISATTTIVTVCSHIHANYSVIIKIASCSPLCDVIVWTLWSQCHCRHQNLLYSPISGTTITTININLSLYTSWRRRGGACVYHHSFLTSALYGGEWSTSRPCCFIPGREPYYTLYRRLTGF